MTRTRARRAGFTLLEVILVAALLLMLTALAVPSIERMYGDMKLDAAADQIRGRWADARARAMEEVRPYVFAVAPGEARFRVAPDRADYWAGGDAPAAGFGDAAERPPLVLEEALPEPIRFAADVGVAGMSSPVAGGWVPVATFLPDGTCREDVLVRLEMDGQVPVTLRLRGLTGSVTATRGEPEEFRP